MNDQPRRTRQNIIALVLLVILVLAGMQLFSRFIRDVAIMKRVTAGHQDCAERTL